MLKDINAFLNEHPEEVVILDFQKIYQCSKEDHEKIIELIESTFRGKLLSKNYNGDLSLSDLFLKKIQVIVISHKHKIYRNAETLVGATFTP